MTVVRFLVLVLWAVLETPTPGGQSLQIYAVNF